MTGYVHVKALRIPAAGIIKSMGVSDLCDVGYMLEKMENTKDHCYSSENDKNKGFGIVVTDKAQYLDYILSCVPDESCSSFGVASLLSAAEKERAKKMFDLLGIEYNLDNIHYVDYCSCTCGYPCDCYDVDDPRF